MSTTTIPVNQARQHLGTLIEEAHYLGKPFLLTRGRKAMAAIIGSREFGRILELIEKHDPGLADTLAIMTNPETDAILVEGDEDIKEGRLIPIEDVMNEL